MKNTISNTTRRLLGLKSIESSWKTMQIGDAIFYYSQNVLEKVIFSKLEDGKGLIIERDTDIQLDNALNIVSGRGKTKPLNLRNVEVEKSKFPILKIKVEEKSVLIQCGVKWLPELSFKSLETINNDILEDIENRYGTVLWNKKVTAILHKPKTRQSYKDGDIVCIRLGAKQYIYALLIGSFQKMRKMDFWPSRDSGHLLSNLMCVPIVLRKYNFVSERNDLELSEILKHPLLNPEIIMDDYLLHGEYKITAHKELTEEEILYPMHYSCYGRRKIGNGRTTGYGMGVFDKENKDNKKAWLKNRLPYYKDIIIVFNWGFGYLEIDATAFLNDETSDGDFIDRLGIGSVLAGIDTEGKLINVYSIFSDEKVGSIFRSMHIDSAIDYDEFNRKYNGLTRKEYLEKIK